MPDKITMDTKSKTPVGAYYEAHHMTGNRLRQSFMEEVRQQMFSSWIGRGKSVLDLGGRDGSLTRHFLDGNRVIIGDIDCAALAHAKETYAVETVEVNLNEPLPFDSDSYDVVVMAEVLEHLPYPHFTLSEVKRVLRDGGEVIGSIPLAYHLKDRWQVLCGKKLWMAGDPTHLQFFTYDEVLSTLSRFFRVEVVRVLKGGKKAEHWPRLFARNVAFRGVKK
jgi:2-polyprenyl-3-methyl-5-hydroxy-6-metoxy-1,4-benzoquinol methylase